MWGSVKQDGRYEGLIEWLVSGNDGAKLLDLLVNYRDFDYSEKELAEAAGISRKTVMRQIPKLVEVGLVRQTKHAGRIMYGFNSESKGAKLLEQTVLCLATIRAKHYNQAEVTRPKPVQMSGDA